MKDNIHMLRKLRQQLQSSRPTHILQMRSLLFGIPH